MRGKGSTVELPLPYDVGEALVSYLRDGRPVSSGLREVFLSARAPLKSLSSAAVAAVVRYACDRAGLERVGAHRLRHTVATELLRAGVPLARPGERECPRICVGMSELERHVYKHKQQDRVGGVGESRRR